MIKAVIFDLDGTLYDYNSTNALGLQALQEYTGAEFGWSPEEFQARHQRAIESLTASIGQKAAVHNRVIRYQTILEQASLPLFPHTLRMYDIYWDTLMAASKCFPGEPEAIRALKSAGLVIGVGTNMTSHIQFRKLTALGILPMIDFIVSSEEACAEKPEKALFDLCAKKAGCLPSECAFVGDSFHVDACGALQAGMKPFWFVPGEIHETVPEILPEEVTVFHSYVELPELILHHKI